VPFVAFVLPVLAPRRVPLTVGLLLLALGMVIAGPGDAERATILGLSPGALPHEPWRTLTWLFAHGSWAQAIASWAGLLAGMTMTSRAIGPRGAWGVLLTALTASTGLAAALPGGLSALTWPALGGVVPVYAVFGMGVVAWWKMREELTYRRRADWLAGFGTIGLAVTALAAPVIRHAPLRPHLFAAVLIGGLGVALMERHWEPSIR